MHPSAAARMAVTLLVTFVGSVSSLNGCGSCPRPVEDWCPGYGCNPEQHFGLTRCGEWVSAHYGEGSSWFDLQTGEVVGVDLGSDTTTCGIYGYIPDNCVRVCTFDPRSASSDNPLCSEKPAWLSEAYYNGTSP